MWEIGKCPDWEVKELELNILSIEMCIVFISP